MRRPSIRYWHAVAVVAVATSLAQAQTGPSPVHFPDATNAPAATAPVAPDPNAGPNWSQPAQTINPPPISVPRPVPTDPPIKGDIRDIRGPISIPYEWFWVIFAAVSLLVAAAIFAIWRFRPRRAAERVRPPYEIALEKLEAARPLMTTETVREYAFAVSEIIRVYIEQRFGEFAHRRTTEEFISDLLSQAWSPLAAHRRRLEDFMNHCDLIKFARWGATKRELELMHESARAFIVETQAQADAPEAAPGAAQPPEPPTAQLAQVK